MSALGRDGLQDDLQQRAETRNRKNKNRKTGQRENPTSDTRG
jgi:hypothetical protein